MKGVIMEYKVVEKRVNELLEVVDKEKYPNATQKYRFELWNRK